jgi:hypothetical protein
LQIHEKNYININRNFCGVAAAKLLVYWWYLHKAGGSFMLLCVPFYRFIGLHFIPSNNKKAKNCVRYNFGYKRFDFSAL